MKARKLSLAGLLLGLGWIVISPGVSAMEQHSYNASSSFAPLFLGASYSYTSLQLNEDIVTANVSRGYLDYFVNPRVGIQMGYSVISDSSGESAFGGLEAALKSYILGSVGPQRARVGNHWLTYEDAFGIYFVGGYRIRNLQRTNNFIRFTGFGAGLGLSAPFQVGYNLLIGGELTFDSLSDGAENEQLTLVNASCNLAIVIP